MDKPIWKVMPVLDDTTADKFCQKLEATMNFLEDEGYEVEEPKPVGKHYFVYGRLPRIVSKEKKPRRKRGDSQPPSSR